MFLTIFICSLHFGSDDALRALHVMPSPEQFIFEAASKGPDPMAASMTELRRVNDSLAAFSLGSHGDQREAMKRLISECRAKVPGFHRSNIFPHEKPYGEIDCNKLDFIAIAKGLRPALDRKSMERVWQRDPMWPSVRFTDRYRPINPSGELNLFDGVRMLDEKDWTKADVLVGLGFYDLPPFREDNSGLNILFHMPSPTGFRWLATDDGATPMAYTDEELSQLNGRLHEFSRLSAGDQRRAMLALIHYSPVLPYVRSHDDASVMFDFGKLDFIRIAKGESPLIDFSGMAAQWHRGKNWPELAVNREYFPIHKRVFVNRWYDLPIDDSILMLSKFRVKAEKLINEGAYDLDAAPSNHK
jgi:hypothetical protein